METRGSNASKQAWGIISPIVLMVGYAMLSCSVLISFWLSDFNWFYNTYICFPIDLGWSNLTRTVWVGMNAAVLDILRSPSSPLSWHQCRRGMCCSLGLPSMALVPDPTWAAWPLVVGCCGMCGTEIAVSQGTGCFGRFKQVWFKPVVYYIYVYIGLSRLLELRKPEYDWGVGWGGMLTFMWTCGSSWCYAHAVNLRQQLMLRTRGVGRGGVGC